MASGIVKQVGMKRLRRRARLRLTLITVVAFFGLGLEVSFGQTPARELPGKTIFVKGEAIVFVFPERAAQEMTGHGSGSPSSEVAGLHAAVGEVRASLLESGIEVLEETSFKYSWGSLPRTKGELFLSPARDFLGTLFFREGKKSEVHEGGETATEVILRAEGYFGRPLLLLRTPGSPQEGKQDRKPAQPRF